MESLQTALLKDIARTYRNYKQLGERAIAQVSDEQLHALVDTDSNSIAIIVKHLAGNLRSRFTDFLKSDGEKPWRNRDEEFDDRAVTRQEFLAKWEQGWSVLFGALDGLTDANLRDTITIRGQAHAVHEALHRSVAHTSYHVGQMVYIAKALRGDQWKSLSIPRGQSQSYVPQGPRG